MKSYWIIIGVCSFSCLVSVINLEADFLKLSDGLEIESTEVEYDGKEVMLKGACQVATMDGDRIQATRMSMNPLTRGLWLEQPRGTLHLASSNDASLSIEFTADEMSWDEQKLTLQLKGNVRVVQNGVLQLVTNQEVNLYQRVNQGNKILSAIEIPSQVEMTYSDALQGSMRKVLCPGFLKIDLEKREVFLQGKKEQQVYIEDTLGEMYADTAFLCYKWENEGWAIAKANLKGHVHLLSRFDGHVEEASSILHEAWASSLDYSPKDHQIILRGTPENRVVCFDKVHQMQMSASSFIVQQEEGSEQLRMRGEGNVRFKFNEKEENAQMMSKV